LKYLNSKAGKNQKIVFVSGENYFELAGGSELNISDHPDIKPYTWAFAHDVRPASQSLGSKSCQDCHSWNSNFFFGKVAVETPFSPLNSDIRMTSFEELGTVYYKLLSLSFFFRPLLKLVIIISLFLISLVVFVFIGKGISAVAKHSSFNSQNHLQE
jgi:hypothetical protein